MRKPIFGLLFLFFLIVNISSQAITVAVLDFKVSSSDDHLDYLADGIPEMLITDLSYQDNITVVERERLTEIIDEQGLSLSGAVDNQEAARIGKLLGVEVMILGSLNQVGDQLRLDAHLVKVESGEAYSGHKVRGVGEAYLFDLVDQLSGEIVASLLNQGVPPGAGSPRMDVAFVIDSTGSMGDEISVVRDKIREIVSTIKMGNPPPDVRFAIVDYKDKGDRYLTRRFDFSRESRAILNYLRGVAAAGGGDNPESVGEGLRVALDQLEWENAPAVTKIMFLIGDAPPHPRENKLWRKMTNLAVGRGVSIFTIACSGMNQTGIDIFKEIAGKTNGQFNFLTYKQSFVAADGRKRDVLLEGKDAYVAEEPLADKDWSMGGSAYMRKAKSGGGAAGKKSMVEREEMAVPSATPEMVASKMESKGWRKDESQPLINNLDSILTNVIKNKAQEKGVNYGSASDEYNKNIAEVRIKNRQREIWIKTDSKKVAGIFKNLADKNATAWFGGQVIPDEKAENGFYFQPSTIIVRSDNKRLAELVQVTLEKISRDADYYNKHGLMTPNRWFVEGQVIDYREED